MNLRYTALFFIFALAAGSHAVTPKFDCKTAARTLVAGVVEKSATTYRITDHAFPDFHITGALRSDGTLSISTYRELSNGDRATLPINDSVREILDYFGKKVERVELKLSQFNNIDEINISKDPEMDRFNKEWKNASADANLLMEERILGPQSRRTQKIVARATLATELGNAIAFKRFDLNNIQLKHSMGNDGRFVAVEVTFSQP